MAITPNYDLDVDTSLGGNNASDYIIPSQKAIKSYVDNNTGSTVDQVYDPTSQAAQSGIAIAGALTDYLQKDVAQSTTGTITFVGQKKIEFKQSAAADKLGFTCFNASGTEIGAFEYRPNTIGSGALFNINVPYSSTSYVGFRYWGTAVNIVAPKVATAGTYYIPVNITDGNTTVTASNAGVLNISSLLPDLSNYLQNTATDTNALSILSNNSNGTATTLIGADTQCSAAAQYGTAIGYHAQLGAVSSAIQLGYGTNSTANSFNVGFFNNTSTHYNWQLLDGTTGLIPDARLSSNIARTNQIPTVPTNISAFTNDSGYITSSALTGYATESFVTSQGYITGITSSDVTDALGYTPSDNTLSNVSSIDSNSAVQTALDAKVNKSGDTMTGGLRINDDRYSINGTFPTSTPSSNTYLVGYELYGNNTRLGLMGLGYYASGNTALYLQHERTVSGTIKYSTLQVGIDDSGNGYCTFPNSNCVDAQWVQKYSKLADTSGTKAGTSYSLSSYLPNDGQKYEVKFRLFAYTSSSTCSYYCNTDIFDNGQTSTTVEADYCFVYSGGYSRQNTVVFDLPVGAGRYVKLYGSGSSSVILCALGYRRIGTNS